VNSVPKAKYHVLKHVLGLSSYMQQHISWFDLAREWGIDFQDVRVAVVLLHDQKAFELYRYTPSGSPNWIPFTTEEEDHYFSQGPQIQIKLLTKARALEAPVKEEYLSSARSAVRSADQHLGIGQSSGAPKASLDARLKALSDAWNAYQDVCEELAGDPNPIPMPGALSPKATATKKTSASDFETAFERYKTEGLIGQGGAGRVYKAASQDGRKVAIKVLDSRSAQIDSTKLKRFKNELGFCSRVLSPYIVPVIDQGYLELTEGKVPFYVMPLYPRSLRDLIKDGIAPSKALPLFRGLIAGVEAAHKQNVVHRDLKPENILYDQEHDRLVVADFGIAQFDEENLLTAVETRDNQRMANFQYAAPEQRSRGAEVDQRADIYALGLILNEMFTGVVPQGTNHKRIATVAAEFGYLDELVDWMLHQDASARPMVIVDIDAKLQLPRAKTPGEVAYEAAHSSKKLSDPPSNPNQSLLERHLKKVILIEDTTIQGKNQFRVEEITPWDVALFKISNSTTYTIALTEIDYHQVVAGQVVLRMKKDWGEYQIAERMMGRNVQ